MQCRNCRFENMPSMQICVRCQSFLNLDHICIQPPRKQRRAFSDDPKFEGLKRFKRKLATRIAQVRFRKISFSKIYPLMLSFLIPGAGQFLFGDPKLGKLTFIAWIVSLILFGLSVGTFLFPVFYFLIIFFHCSAVLYYLKEELRTETKFKQFLFSFCFFFILQFFYYDFMIYMAGNFSRVIRLNNILYRTEMIKNHDVLTYQGRWFRNSFYNYGDLVVYQVAGGHNVNRIVGLPGDTIEITRERKLFVNEECVELEDAFLGVLPSGTYHFTVPSSHYCIIPGLLQVRGVAGGNYYQRQMKLWMFVRKEAVLGKVTWRIRPLNRFGGLGEDNE